MTFDQVDSLLVKLAFKNYLVQYTAATISERNEYLIQLAASQKLTMTLEQKIDSYQRSIELYKEIIENLYKEEKIYKRKLRNARIKGYITTAGLVVLTYIIATH